MREIKVNTWSVSFTNIEDDKDACGYFTVTRPTSKDIKEYREIHDLPEEKYRVSIYQTEYANGL